MENKLPTKGSHVWTLSDFIERRKDWDLGDETRLAEHLQQLSNKITQGAKNTLNKLDDLVASVDDTAIKIANINNEFQLLADKQFIENKVQEEDETVHIKIKKPIVEEVNDADVLVTNLKEALKNSFKAIDSHFEKVTVVVSDSDDDDELKHEEVVLRPRTFYKKINLPSIIHNTQSEIAIDNAMSSDSDSYVEQPTNTFKDEESLSSNDVSERDMQSISESKSLHETNILPTHTYSNNFEPEKPKSVPTYIDNIEDDLFRPPPLLNDDEEDDFENEYNIFGNNSNVYGERNLWDDNDDDDNYYNEPPLPIYSDELPVPIYSDKPTLPILSEKPSVSIYSELPPHQIIKSNIQEKVEVPNIQQSLNNELKKRFQKVNNPSLPENSNIEPPKIKIPKGAVNILGGTDIKPYAADNKKHATISQSNKNMTETVQKSNIDDINKDLYKSNILIESSNKNSVLPSSKDLKKVRSFFEQDSDNEDIFAEKTSNIISTSEQEISKQKDTSIKNIKSSRTIFSESDSDEEFVNSKSTIKKVTSCSIVSNNSSKFLDFSSDDDLFDIKSNDKKSITNQKSTIFSSSTQDEHIINVPNQIQNEVNQNSKSLLVEEKNAKNILNEDITNEEKLSSKDSNIFINNKDSKENSLQNHNVFNSNILKSPKIDNTILINQKSSNLQKKKISSLFSSDEDDLEDNTFLNVSNKKVIKKDQMISNSSVILENQNNELSVSKTIMFDSSSDDDIFSTNKLSNNFTSTNMTSYKQPESKKMIVETLNSNNDCITINQLQNSECIDNEKKSVNNFSLLSGNDGGDDDADDDDDDYFSFNNTISNDSKNISDIQNINESIKTLSFSSEEFLSPEVNLKNKDIFQSSSSKNLPDIKNKSLSNEKEMNLPQNKMITASKGNKIQENKLSLFSSSDDEQQLSFNSNIQNENNTNKTEGMYSNLNSPPESLLDNKNQKQFNDKDNTCQNLNSSILSSNNNDQKLSQNENSVMCSKELLKDSIDGSSFSSPNLKNETTKKIPGKLSKNAGAFINIAGLLPNSKSPLKIPNIPRSTSLDENNDNNLPTSETKLFSAEKERAKIQVKRRPQSRKARLEAARMSSVDIDYDSNFKESSRLFNSTSDLVNYQSSPTLDYDIKTDFLSDIKNKIQKSFDIKLPEVNNDNIFENVETNNVIDKKSVLNVFNDDSSLIESIQENTNKKNVYSDSIEKKLVDNLLKSKSINKELSKVESSHEIFSKTCSLNENQPDIESINDKHSIIESVYYNQVDELVKKNLIENKSHSNIQNNKLSKKSLFDDDDDDDDDDNLFSSKSEKVEKPSSNLFDGDNEIEFNQKFSKRNLLKTKSIFSDDSDDDDDLFSTPTKPLTNSTFLPKSVDKLNQPQSQSCLDGYVKLAAKSVIVNPLESEEEN